MKTYGRVLSALADEHRRTIVERLASGPAAVGELAEGVPVSRPAVSQHLRVLLDAGLVTFESEGNRNVYRLDRAGIEPLREWLDQFWNDVLRAFENYATEASDRKE